VAENFCRISTDVFITKVREEGEEKKDGHSHAQV
jgi:hypothetical protein